MRNIIMIVAVDMCVYTTNYHVIHLTVENRNVFVWLVQTEAITQAGGNENILS